MEKKSTSVLTNQEIILMALICCEYTSKEIATFLNVDTSIITRLRKQLKIKTRSKNTVGIAIYALRNGIVKV